MLSVIIPSYNGAPVLNKQLPGLIAYLTRKKIHHEIIIVDDGSDDYGGTKRVATENKCIYIRHKINNGKGAAVRSGMLKAKGGFRIYTDVDIPFTLDSFKQFLRYLDFKEFDVVIGDRTLTGSSYAQKIPFIRKLGSDIFSFLAGRFVAGGYFDTQCGMKGFRSEAAEDIFSVSKIDGFAFDVEILYIALKRNYDIKRLPVKLRSNETSSVKIVRHGIQMLFDLFSLPINNLMGKYKR